MLRRILAAIKKNRATMHLSLGAQKLLAGEIHGNIAGMAFGGRRGSGGKSTGPVVIKGPGRGGSPKTGGRKPVPAPKS